MGLFVGLDVSQKTTSVCVIDSDGQRRWRCQCQSAPTELARTIERHAGSVIRIDVDRAALPQQAGPNLVPGMPMEAFIQTRDRTALSCILKPLTEHFTRALREE